MYEDVTSFAASLSFLWIFYGSVGIAFYLLVARRLAFVAMALPVAVFLADWSLAGLRDTRFTEAIKQALGYTYFVQWIGVPFVPIAGVLLGLAVYYVCASRRRRLRAGLCIRCGYCLRGLPKPRCPECGSSFEALGIRSSCRAANPAGTEANPLPPTDTRRRAGLTVARVSQVYRQLDWHTLAAPLLIIEAPAVLVLRIAKAPSWMDWVSLVCVVGGTLVLTSGRKEKRATALALRNVPPLASGYAQIAREMGADPAEIEIQWKALAAFYDIPPSSLRASDRNDEELHGIVDHPDYNIGWYAPFMFAGEAERTLGYEARTWGELVAAACRCAEPVPGDLRALPTAKGMPSDETCRA